MEQQATWTALYDSGRVDTCEAADLDEAIDILARGDDALAYAPAPLDSEMGQWISQQEGSR